MLPFALLTTVNILSLGLAKAPTYSDSIFSPYIAQKYARVGSNYRPGEFPSLTDATGKWVFMVPDWWTSGFFPANFYLLHERKQLCPKDKHLSSVDWLALGRRWTLSFALQHGNTRGHDQYFLSLPYTQELKVNPTNATAIEAIKNFNNLLAVRYSNIVGCTRSWPDIWGGITDDSGPDFLVIIDNMMNLKLLFEAAKYTKNHTLVEMAVSHANKTIANHLRPDGSSYHVVDYNEDTSGIIWKHTSQGYADNSTWTRGQAWGIYGFASMFHQTKKAHFLATARTMAKLFLSRIPSNGIVPWDFDAPSAGILADSSAAMVAAQGLFVLSAAEKHTGNSTGASYYQKKAVKLMTDTFKFAFQPTWDSILSNGTSNNPRGSNNTGIVYGDYYALKAGNTMLKLGLASC